MLGFDRSLIELPVPSYTQLCRRAKGLGKKLEKLTKNPIRDIAIDSTGIKIYGEGEWKVRQHGQRKRRTWRKVHLAINPQNGEIIMSQLTDNSTTDAAVGETMLKKCGKGVTNFICRWSL